MYMNDLNAFGYPADLVVNDTLYGDKLPYPQKRLIYYALLRKEFRNVPKREAAEQVKNVLLSTDGADPEHMALVCVQYLREQPFDGVTYHVIIGGMNQDIAEIKRLSAGCTYIALHQNASDMRSLMLQCDVAISAGGTTLFELCACGVPTVTYVLAENLVMNAMYFADAGLMLNAEDIRKKTVPRSIFLKL